MSWVTVIWAMIVSACLTLVLVWWRRREPRVNLLFSPLAVAVAVFAGCEFWMMRAETPAAFSMALRWLHAPTWSWIVSLVRFVRLYPTGWAIVVGLDGLRRADALADHQFCLHPESQLSGRSLRFDTSLSLVEQSLSPAVFRTLDAYRLAEKSRFWQRFL
jgi:hypothetical protein